MSDKKNQLLPKAEVIIKRHVLFSSGAGLIPIPVLDVFAVTAIQLDMIKQLCKLYGQDYQDTSGKAWVGTLVGNIFSRMGAARTRYFLKAIPLIGPAIGGITVSAFSGVTTYAIGQVLVQHLATGGSLATFNEQEIKTFFEDQLQKGKDLVKTWVTETPIEAPPKKPEKKSPPSTKERLEHLEELKIAGYVTKTEYERIKKRLEKSTGLLK